MLRLPRVGDTYRGAARDRLAAMEAYWDAGAAPPGYDSYVRPPLGQGGDKFYDDNWWGGLDLARYQRTTGDASWLGRLRQVFDFGVSGWDADPTHPYPGGVFWVQASWNRDRGVVSNAPGAQVGLHLYELTGRAMRAYLDWAQRMFDWTNRTLRAPSGLYWDKVYITGGIDRTLWSYNQGSMVGAGLAFHHITGADGYLEQAEATAAAALDHYGRVGYSSQPAIFNAILFRNLLDLGAVNGNGSYRRAMQAYADQAWNDARVRDPRTNLFKFDAGSSSYHLLDQAAMVHIYALLAADAPIRGPRPRVEVSAVAGRDARGGLLRVTVSGGAPPLAMLRFGTPRPAQNAIVEVDGRPVAGDVPLPAGATQASFVVRRATPGQATTVPFTVVDAHGPWETFVGGGPNAF
jgi:hypothetical protein